MANKKKSFVLWFKDVNIKDVGLVGGKNAALGEMFSSLTRLGINVPNGFAITAYAYRYFLEKAGLKNKIRQALRGLDTKNLKDLRSRGRAVRQLILQADLPEKLENVITAEYEKMGKIYSPNPDVAVRSSATAEDLPGASFAGQQETFLNIRGKNNVLLATKKCIASLFTDRAISYRVDKGFSHFDVALSVSIQKMVRSDLASSGVAFTIDTESGFENIVVINGIYGLGELIVQGKVTPDEFIIFKPTLGSAKNPIIAHDIGRKNIKMVYSGTETKIVPVGNEDRTKYSLTDREVIKLASWCVKIEEHFSKIHHHYQPMDIEWAKDGRTGELYIVQARPETVQSIQKKDEYLEFSLKKRSRALLSGVAVGAKVGAGQVRVIRDVKRIMEFRPGEVLVTEITDPDWEPIMKIASAIVTDKGGRTSHAAIVSRELGIPCIVGSETATKILRNGQKVTVDCSSGERGTVYEGKLSYSVKKHHLGHLPKTRTKIMVNIGSPDEAFKYHYLPVDGVGLGRLEFIISSHIQIHPNALLDFEKIKHSSDPRMKRIAAKIEQMTPGYKDKKHYYIDELAEGVAKIGASFWPRKVIIRFSDFKTNEYSKLLGGELYEPKEENPMIGWRGASRYYHPEFAEAFKLECRALRKVREEMGLDNIIPMIPFCRTVAEGKQTLEIMKHAGLPRSKKMPVYVMCEIPSNIILADKFLDIFDGMSIGSNDLTQLTLGLDRDSGIVSKVSNEKDAAVKELLQTVIGRCREREKYSGICGQAPSDYPDFAQFLVENRIESISLNPDTILKTKLAIASREKKLRKGR